MKRLLTSALCSLLLTGFAHSQAHRRAGRPLPVISVDGLDYRYLRDCDKLGLKIPNLRRLMREGEVTEGIVGVFPTVTWPSHTTLITGADPRVHGILGNRRPREEGGDYYWDVSLLKTKTLWHAAREGKHGVGREIPSAELLQFTPNFANVAAAFEPAAHHLFGSAADGQTESKPAEAGVHGLWPARADYRASFVLWGKGTEAARKPEAPMGAIAPRLAELLGVKMPGERR